MGEILTTLQKGGQWFLDALFPPKCVICRKEGSHLCAKHRRFSLPPKNTVPYKTVEKVASAVGYEDETVKTVVKYFKFFGFQELRNIAAAEMLNTGKELWENRPEDAILIPIPLHWTRRIWRGYNQSEALCQAMTEQEPRLRICTQLKRIKKTRQQARLGKTERLQNIRGAFVWRGAVPTGTIVLVDDVVASGATLEAAAEAVKKAGGKKVYALTFARGGR